MSRFRRRFALLLTGAMASTGVLFFSSKTIEPTMARAFAGASPMLPHVGKLIARVAPLRIVAFGSSSTQGIGASSPAASYPSRLEAILAKALPGGIEVINAGIGGEDADDMIRRLPAVVARHPDLVIWQTGSNDPLRNIPLDRFTAETRRGIRLMRDAGADVMLMEAQDCRVLREDADTPRFRVALRAIAAEMHVPMIRRYDLMHEWLDRGVIKKADLTSGDGLHMTDAGYARLAENVAQQILALGGPAAGR